MKLYTVKLGGVDHYMRLSEEDAKRYDAVPVEQAPAAPQKAAQEPANKSARRPRNKSAGQ